MFHEEAEEEQLPFKEAIASTLSLHRFDVVREILRKPPNKYPWKTPLIPRS
jgi:hypothetical protein